MSLDIGFAVGVGCYALTTATYLASLWTSHVQVAGAARWFLRGTLLLWLGLLVGYGIEAGYAGGTRLWLGFSGWSLGVVYLFLARRYPIAALGSFVSALATVLAALAYLVHTPSAAMTSGAVGAWLLRIHIGLAFVGVTAFAFATAVSVVYLMQARSLKNKRKRSTDLRRRLPPLDVLDRLSLRSIVIGFPFYTVALLLGSFHAVRGEGGVRLTYVVAMVSWMIYGAVLQARLTAGWRGRRAAILTACGLVAVMAVVTQYSLGAA